MTEMTLSLRTFLWKFHKDIYTLILFGHTELFSSEVEKEYIDWLNTKEGRSFLKESEE